MIKSIRKTDFVIVRVTKSEKDKLVNDAKENGLTLSQYVRKLMKLDK